MLYQLWWRKKKVDFIIPPTFFRRSDFSITEVQSTKSEVENVPEIKEAIEVVEKIIVVPSTEPQPTTDNRQQITENRQPTTTEPKVSSLSLSSIKAKKELLEAQKGIVKEAVHLPTQVFTETEMQEFWFKYADKLGDKGYKIMESLLRINDPKLDGTSVIHELPNEGSKIDFYSQKQELLTYLRSHLHNHEITIEIVVNEKMDSKKAFTTLDKFNRLNEINPNLEVLKKTFDLDIWFVAKVF